MASGQSLQPVDTDGILRLLPEISLICDSDIQEQVVDIFDASVPSYWWIVPASSTGKYHPPEHNRRHGLWFHTKRAFVVFEELVDSTNIGKDSIEADCGRGAILLHDMFKYGVPPRAGGDYEYNEGDYTESNHDVLAADWLSENTALPEEVIGCVLSHNGKWGQGRRPQTNLEWTHHRADYLASRKNVHGIAVYKPAQELRDTFDDILVECDIVR